MADVSYKLNMYKKQKKCYTRKHKDNLQYLDNYKKLSCLCLRRSELALRLDEEIVVTAVVPLNVEVKHSFVVETSTTRAHQQRQPEMMQQGMEYQPCHRHEILVADLTFLVDPLPWAGTRHHDIDEHA